MTLDWCPGIREACGHWRDAPMLQQTLEAMELNLEQSNDAHIGLVVNTARGALALVVEQREEQGEE